MQRVPVTELKNKLSEYLRLVKQGETIEILEHSVPIARILAIRESAGNGLERLIRDGIVTAASEKPAALEKPLPCTGDVAAAVVEERGDR